MLRCSTSTTVLTSCLAGWIAQVNGDALLFSRAMLVVQASSHHGTMEPRLPIFCFWYQLTNHPMSAPSKPIPKQECQNLVYECPAKKVVFMLILKFPPISLCMFQ